MIVLSASVVAQAVNGRLVSGDPSRVFATISTDSRALPDRAACEPALFIALAGPTFDGHAFVPDLIARGVGGVLVSAPVAAAGATAVIEVADTLVALQQLARHVRRASGARNRNGWWPAEQSGCCWPVCCSPRPACLPFTPRSST